MRTESTFSVGVLAAAVEVADPAAPELAPSRVPVISILWPTCGVSFESSPFRRYCVPDADDVCDWVDDELALDDGLAAPAPGLVVLVDDVVLFVPIDAFVNMNPPALALRPAVPVVPVVPSPRCRQPVKVVAVVAEVWVVRLLDPGGVAGVCAGGGFCAITTAATPSVRAAQVLDQVRTFIIPPSFQSSRPVQRSHQTNPNRIRDEIMRKCTFGRDAASTSCSDSLLQSCRAVRRADVIG